MSECFTLQASWDFFLQLLAIVAVVVVLVGGFVLLLVAHNTVPDKNCVRNQCLVSLGWPVWLFALAVMCQFVECVLK